MESRNRYTPSAFQKFAPCADPVLYRTYSRRAGQHRETWNEIVERTVSGMARVGKLSDAEVELIKRHQQNRTCLSSGRWLWIGGTPWIEQQKNFPGAYNCISQPITDWRSFGLLMDLAMMGCGTGAVLEPWLINQLPEITNPIQLEVLDNLGTVPADERYEFTVVVNLGELAESENAAEKYANTFLITVGDSREGWVRAYELLLEMSTYTSGQEVKVIVDLSNVRPVGSRIQGFGGVANPAELAPMFHKVVGILNRAVGRCLGPVECCLLLDEAAVTIVAGNVRRTAGIRQFEADDAEAAAAKDNLWQQSEDGSWRIDPARDALRMANHTRVYHYKPSYNEVLEAVRKQYYSGEGAIQYAPEAVARCNADLLNTPELKQGFIDAYLQDEDVAKAYLTFLMPEIDDEELEHRVTRYGTNPCLAPGTLVFARIEGSEGSHTVESLVGRSCEVWDGSRWVEIEGFRVTGKDESLLRIETDCGDVMLVTPAHTMILSDGSRIPAHYLLPGVALLKSTPGLDESGRGLAYVTSIEPSGVAPLVYCCTVPESHSFTLANGVVVGNCGEIIGNTFKCNLSEIHLNLLSPEDIAGQTEAFTAGAISVCSLLHHEFLEERYRKSREWDPIVAVSFTGLFDFFVNAFGVDWLRWWAVGRPQQWGETVQWKPLGRLYSHLKPGGLSQSEFFKRREQEYLAYWREVVRAGVEAYCTKHGLRVPNRYTTVQPAGCGSRELLRVFDQGLIYADEVMEDGQGEVLDIGLTVRGGVSASTGIANQPLNLVKVTLNNGRVLRLTPNHRLSVEGDWVFAEELLPGMQIDYQVGTYKATHEAALQSVDLSHYRKFNPDLAVGEYKKGYLTPVRFPAEMNPDLAYFLGALFGNGTMDVKGGTKRVRFCHGDFGIITRVSATAEKLFGVQGTLHQDNNRAELCIASKPLYDWLVLNGLNKDTKSKNLDRIPLAVRSSSTESVLGFFCGLIDTDGCVRQSRSLSIESASEKFIRNLQQIGEAVGLCFAVSHNTKGSNHQTQKSIWSLVLSRMLSTQESLSFLNKVSSKCTTRPLPSPSRTFKFTPYAVASVEWEQEQDYSFDFAIDGVDDNDSWYWQGALKSHNTKSLLTGASPGWHPPKAARFIRRVTFRRDDPVALACRDYGYRLVPSQSCKDEDGKLLDNYLDPRVTEWLVEIPTEVPWASLPGADEIDISQFSSLAQFDFYMQVQQYYTLHNSSATIEYREHEIEDLAKAIYSAIEEDRGYISAALLARFDANETFPRLPFEPINAETYEQLCRDVRSRQVTADFYHALERYDRDAQLGDEVGPAGCDSDKCLLG